MVNQEYAIVSTEDIDYGYTEDLASEAKLLTSIGMEHILTPIKIVTQSIDE